MYIQGTTEFQFQDGSIKCIILALSGFKQLSFNSKMVRLNAAQSCKILIVMGCFNSKMVRLNVFLPLNWTNTLTCFNSKMVRLNVKKRVPTSRFDVSFNSKMVRLNAQLPYRRIRLLTCFNSKMVRLNDLLIGYTVRTLKVSIPRWFD